MNTYVQSILNWAEVWGLALPLFFIIIRKNIPDYLQPVRLYVILAFILNICSNVVWKFKDNFGFEPGDFFWSNNFLYNTHSIVRLLLFSWFFILLKQPFIPRIKLILPVMFMAFVLVNFTLHENFFNRQMLSSRLLATEAAILLFYCLQYFIYLLVEDRSHSLAKQPGIWVVTGLSIYVAACFFIFLFYTYLIQLDIDFAVSIWNVHNLAYIILCIFLARAFYEPERH